MAKLVIGTAKTAGTPSVVRDVSPVHYIEYVKDSNDKLTSSNDFINTDDITNLGDYAFPYLYYKRTSFDKNIEFPDLQNVDGEWAFYYTFYNTRSSTVSFPALEEVWGKESFSHTFANNTSLISANFHNLKKVLPYLSSGFESTFNGCTSLTSIDFHSFNGFTDVQYNSYKNTFTYMCYGCTSLTDVDFSSLEYLMYCGAAFSNTFRNCTGLKSISFPKLVLISSQEVFYNIFSGCSSLESINMPYLTRITGRYCFRNAFDGCNKLETFSFSKLLFITSDQEAFKETFKNCTSLKHIYFNSLLTRSDLNNIASYLYTFLSGCSNVTVHFPANLENKISTSNTFGGTNTIIAFDLPAVTKLNFDYLENVYLFSIYQGCLGATDLTDVSFPVLKRIDGSSGFGGFHQMFYGCTSLQNVSFYALDPDKVSINAFNNMLYNCSNVKVRFPLRLYNKAHNQTDFVNGFGGTNTTVLFDIITSLIGTDTNTYIRSQNDSTPTATAWLYNDTLYYTSGMTEPVVGDTIYSDASCTTAVTTISSIV